MNDSEPIRTASEGCPGDAALRRLLAEGDPGDGLGGGDGPDAARAAVERHLESCPACQQRLDELAGQDALGTRLKWCGGNTLCEDAVLGEALQTARAAGGSATPPSVAASSAAGAAAGNSVGEDEVRRVLEQLVTQSAPGILGRVLEYDLLSVLGQGAMGLVLRARDRRLHRHVAIKVLASRLAGDPKYRARFLREARAAAAIGHPNVVTVYAIEDAAALPMIVMECVQGETLADAIRRAGPMKAVTIARAGRQIARGLQAAHACGILHRDIKPSNILLETASGRVIVSDFGLALPAGPSELTRDGVIVGTPEYMSPEQVRGAPLDARSDLFSLGSVLYAMAAGRPPYAADSLTALLLAVAEARPRPIEELRADLPADLLAVLRKLHARDPADRFASAAEAGKALGACKPGPAEATVAGFPSRLTPPAIARVDAPTHVDAPPVVCPPAGTDRTPTAVGPPPVVGRPNRSKSPAAPAAASSRARRPAAPHRRWLAVAAVAAGFCLLCVVAGWLMFRGGHDGSPSPATPLGTAARAARNGHAPPKTAAPSASKQAAPAAHGAEGLAPPGIFLGSDPGGKRYSSLAAAIADAEDDATIMIADAGPHRLAPLRIERKLRIRAARGFQPLVLIGSSGAGRPQPAIHVRAALTIEGLTVAPDASQLAPAFGPGSGPGPGPDSRPGSGPGPTFGPGLVPDGGGPRYALFVEGASLRAVNCRLELPGMTLLTLDPPRQCEIVDCELSGGRGFEWGSDLDDSDQGRLHVQNSLICADTALMMPHRPQTRRGRVEWQRCTVLSNQILRADLPLDQLAGAMRSEVAVTAADSLLLWSGSLLALDSNGPPGQPAPAGSSDMSPSAAFQWTGSRNVYGGGGCWFASRSGFRSVERVAGDLARWRTASGSPETDSRVEAESNAAVADLLGPFSHRDPLSTPGPVRPAGQTPAVDLARARQQLQALRTGMSAAGAEVTKIGPGAPYDARLDHEG
jgi:tRNA A-37 threonylcarbamoyl transferase component Bud32